jgi:hypothetical protein
MYRVIKMLCDCLAAAGVAGQENVAAYVALLGADMKLHADVLHGRNLLVKNI